MINTVVLEILVAAVAYICIAITVQRRLSNMPKMYAMQAAVQVKAKELNDMAKAGADQAVLMAKQKEMSAMLMSSMKYQIRPLLVVLPMFLIVYYYLLPLGFANAPFPHISILSLTLTYKTLFFYTVFILGLVISLSLTFRDKRRYGGAPVQPGTTT